MHLACKPLDIQFGFQLVAEGVLPLAHQTRYQPDAADDISGGPQVDIPFTIRGNDGLITGDTDEYPLSLQRYGVGDAPYIEFEVVRVDDMKADFKSGRDTLPRQGPEITHIDSGGLVIRFQIPAGTGKESSGETNDEPKTIFNRVIDISHLILPVPC